MENKTTRKILKVLAGFGLVGGAVHLLSPLGFDLLGKVSSIVGTTVTPWIQFVAGLGTLVVIFMLWKKI
jgi:hypothetical protein